MVETYGSSEGAAAVTALEDVDPSSLTQAGPPAALVGPAGNSSTNVDSGNLAATGVQANVAGQPIAVTPLNVASGVSAPDLSSYGGTVYANAAPASNLADTVKGDSVEFTVQQLSAAAPESYAWHVGATPGAQLIDQSDGSVALVNAAGAIIANFTAPRVLSASGASVPATVTGTGQILQVAVGPATASDYPMEISTSLTGGATPDSPVGADGDYCSGAFSRPGTQTAYVATNNVHGVVWLIQWSGAATQGVDELTSYGYQYISHRQAGSPYMEQPQKPNYKFHGSLNAFMFVGSSTNHNVSSGDYYQLYFFSNGMSDTNTFGGYVTRSCYVQ